MREEIGDTHKENDLETCAKEIALRCSNNGKI